MRRFKTTSMWIIIVQILTILAVVTFGTTACDEKKAEVFLAEHISEILPVIAGELLNTPEVQAALGEGGEPLAQAALAVMLPLVQNRISELATSEVADERLAYRRIQAAHPDLAAMIYRVGDGGVARGLWPRLDSWLKVKGYRGAAALWRDLAGRTPTILINPADKEELIDLMVWAIIEEYRAVRDGKATYSLPDFEDES